MAATAGLFPAAPCRFLCVCDSCDSAFSTVFCVSDAAFLCDRCDLAIHANRIALRHLRVPFTQCPVWAYRDAKGRGRLREVSGLVALGAAQQRRQQQQQQALGGSNPLVAAAPQLDQEKRWGVEVPLPHQPDFSTASRWLPSAAQQLFGSAESGSQWTGLAAEGHGALASAGHGQGGEGDFKRGERMTRPHSGTLSSQPSTSGRAGELGAGNSTPGAVADSNISSMLTAGSTDMLIARTSLNGSLISSSLLAQQQRAFGSGEVDDTQPLVLSLYQHWATQNVGTGPLVEPHGLELPPLITAPSQRQHLGSGLWPKHPSSTGAANTAVSNCTYSSSHGAGIPMPAQQGDDSMGAAAAAGAGSASLTATASTHLLHQQELLNQGSRQEAQVATSLGQLLTDVVMADMDVAEHHMSGNGARACINQTLASLLEEFKLPDGPADAFASLDLPPSPRSVGQSSHMQLGDEAALLHRAALGDELPALLTQPTTMMAAHLQKPNWNNSMQQLLQQPLAGSTGATACQVASQAAAAAATADVRQLPNSFKSSQTLATSGTPDFAAAGGGGGHLDLRSSPACFPSSASNGSQGLLGASLQYQHQQPSLAASATNPCTAPQQLMELLGSLGSGLGAPLSNNLAQQRQQQQQQQQQQKQALAQSLLHAASMPPNTIAGTAAAGGPAIHRSSPVPIGGAMGSGSRGCAGLGAIDELGGAVAADLGLSAFAPLMDHGHATAPVPAMADAVAGLRMVASSDPLALTRALMAAAAARGPAQGDEPRLPLPALRAGGLGALLSTQQLQLLARAGVAAGSASMQPSASLPGALSGTFSGAAGSSLATSEPLSSLRASFQLATIATPESSLRNGFAAALALTNGAAGAAPAAPDDAALISRQATGVAAGGGAATSADSAAVMARLAAVAAAVAGLGNPLPPQTGTGSSDDAPPGPAAAAATPQAPPTPTQAVPSAPAGGGAAGSLALTSTSSSSTLPSSLLASLAAASAKESVGGALRASSLFIETASVASIEARARALINSTSRSSLHSAFAPNIQMRIERPDGTIRELHPERAMQLHRYKQKRLARMKALAEGQKKVRYECRKQLADTRPRIKGRFVRASSSENLGVLFSPTSLSTGGHGVPLPLEHSASMSVDDCGCGGVPLAALAAAGALDGSVHGGGSACTAGAAFPSLMQAQRIVEDATWLSLDQAAAARGGCSGSGGAGVMQLCTVGSNNDGLLQQPVVASRANASGQADARRIAAGDSGWPVPASAGGASGDKTTQAMAAAVDQTVRGGARVPQQSTTSTGGGTAPAQQRQPCGGSMDGSASATLPSPHSRLTATRRAVTTAASAPPVAAQGAQQLLPDLLQHLQQQLRSSGNGGAPLSAAGQPQPSATDGPPQHGSLYQRMASSSGGAAAALPVHVQQQQRQQQGIYGNSTSAPHALYHAATSLALAATGGAPLAGSSAPSADSPCLGSTCMTPPPPQQQHDNNLLVLSAELDAAFVAACENECMTFTDQELRTMGLGTLIQPPAKSPRLHSAGSSESMSTINHEPAKTHHHRLFLHQSQHLLVQPTARPPRLGVVGVGGDSPFGPPAAPPMHLEARPGHDLAPPSVRMGLPMPAGGLHAGLEERHSGGSAALHPASGALANCEANHNEVVNDLQVASMLDALMEEQCPLSGVFVL